MNKILMGVLAVVLLPGCGVTFFVPPEEDAVVDEHVYLNPSIFGLLAFEETGIRALSTKAERRLVLMNRQKGYGGYNIS